MRARARPCASPPIVVDSCSALTLANTHVAASRTHTDDARAARITTIDTWGGPIDGGTWVRLTGRLFADLRRARGELSGPTELIPYDAKTPDERWRMQHQLRPVPGATDSGQRELWTPYDGSTSEGGGWVLQCRFGSAGHSDAVLSFETAYEWDEATNQMRSVNATDGASGMSSIPTTSRESRSSTPVVWCQAPALRNHTGLGSYGRGRHQWVTLDLTLNGQDYIVNGARPFLYYPRDAYMLDCSKVGNTSSDHDCFRPGGERYDAYVARYRGTVNVTANGRECQQWAIQSPHAHGYTPEAYPDAGLDGDHNFCRSPGGLRHRRPFCLTTDPAVRWEVCDVGSTSSEAAAELAGPTPSLGGVRIERLHPFGGPHLGGTSVTLIGRNFRALSRAGPTGMLCNFGNQTADGAPLGGPARTLVAGAARGELPWHVPATLLNSTHAVCTSPPVVNMSNGSRVRVAVDLSLNGQLADLTDSRAYFQYYGPEVLSVRWIYPKAGPKRGGSVVTFYGTGFQSLGLSILGPVDRTTGVVHSHRGIKCLFGDLPMTPARVVHPIGSDRARPALGDDPDSGPADDEPLASVIECAAPAWSNASSTYALTADEHATGDAGADHEGREDEHDADADRCTADDGRALCVLDEPKTVCVRVTLNDDPHQNSGGCVQYTYFDE